RVHDRTAGSAARGRPAPTALPCRQPAVRRRHVLRGQPRRARRQDVLLWMAGAPALAGGGRAREADVMRDERRLAIDIVVPVYNEESVVAEFHRRLMDVVTPLRREHEVRITYVNDGSVDHTGAELLKLAND